MRMDASGGIGTLTNTGIIDGSSSGFGILTNGAVGAPINSGTITGGFPPNTA